MRNLTTSSASTNPGHLVASTNTVRSPRTLFVASRTQFVASTNTVRSLRTLFVAVRTLPNMVRGSTNTVRSSSNTPEHGSWLHEHCSWQFEHSPDMVRGASHTVCMHAYMHPPMLLIPSSAEFVVCLVCDHSLVGGCVTCTLCVCVVCPVCVAPYHPSPAHTCVTCVTCVYTCAPSCTLLVGHEPRSVVIRMLLSGMTRLGHS